MGKLIAELLKLRGNTHFITYVRTIVGRGARPCAPEYYATTPKTLILPGDEGLNLPFASGLLQGERL